MIDEVKPAHSNRRPTGFSLLELVIMVAITVVVFAIAAPALMSSIRGGDLTAAQAEMAAAVRRASEEAATGGARIEFSASTVHVPRGVALNPAAICCIPGARISGDITFQGGTGYPWVGRANQDAAIILADESDLTKAVAIVVGASGTVKRLRLAGTNVWEVTR